MPRRSDRDLWPRVLVVALCSVALVVAAVAASEADPRSGRAVSVAMLSGGEGALVPAADLATAAPEAASLTPDSPPPTGPSTTTTSAADAADRAVAVTTRPQPKPCRTNGAPDRPCGPPCPHPARGDAPAQCPLPPCPQPGSANSATACPPPCAEPAAPPAEPTPVASDATVVEPARPACPPPAPPSPPTCRQYDIRTGSSQPCPPPCPSYDSAGDSSSTCPQPCPALATANGEPAPCPAPPPCPQPQYDNGVTRSTSACPPPPCAYPAEPDGGTGATQPQLMIYCPPPCYDTPDGSGSPCPPPPPPPCPSAAPTDQSCTPPCSYEPASGGPAAGASAPCASGVTGRVTAGPTCPVERPDEPCPDKPVETTLRLLRRDDAVAATGKSSSDGSFRMVAAPGGYRLVADWPSRIGGCGPVEVIVEYGRFAYADVGCDTGIR